MIITSKLTMDLIRHSSTAIVRAMQDDRYSRNLELSLYSDGEAWKIPEAASVLIRYSKPDGRGGEYDTLPDGSRAWAFTGNVLTVALAPQVLTVPGAVRLTVTLMQEHVQLSTFAVMLRVEPAVNARIGESETYFHVPGFLPAPAAAEAGQYFRISSVDSAGHVTGVEAVTLDADMGISSEPATEDIPRVFFGGALPQSKEEMVMPFRYVSKTREIRGYCKTRAQGSSSMAYPKKNQTVRLYRDADCTEDLKVSFKNWGPQSRFCFKANWIDLTHARNIVSARLWGDVVGSRPVEAQPPRPLQTSPNRGAVDGFPVKVYADGIYQGRYTLNIPKDPWMANMDAALDTHCILCGENYESGCFRAEAAIDGTDWTDEAHETVPGAIKARWNEAIAFVRNSTDDEFVSGIGNFFDIQSLIDYYLFGLASCGLDAFGKNQLYMTYDGQKWYATMYDMDSTWGLYWDGSRFVSATYGRSSFQDFVDGAGNLLYIRLEALFMEQIKTRWEELRRTALSFENILNRFEEFTTVCPPWLVEEDFAQTTAEGAYTGIPLQDTNNIQQIRDYIRSRMHYTDMLIANAGSEYLYNLAEAVTFDGTSGIDTGIALFDSPKDFTILIRMDAQNYEDADTRNPVLLTCNGETGLIVKYGGGNYWQVLTNDTKDPAEDDVNGNWGHTWEATKAMVLVFAEGVFSFGKYRRTGNDGILYIQPHDSNAYQQSGNTLWLGIRDNNTNGWIGTIHDFRVYSRALSEEEAIALISEEIA